MTAQATVGRLIEDGVRVTHSCQWCGFHGETDLRRIAQAKGPDFSLMDRLPLCTNGECRGMLRFKVYRGCRNEWLMTAAGDARFQKHSDWMFNSRMVETRRRHQVETRSSSLDSVTTTHLSPPPAK